MLLTAAPASCKLPGISQDNLTRNEAAAMSSVLVIDDEKFVLDTLAAVLTKFGHDVHTASNGRQGIEKFDNGSFDVVITDIRMPEVDGNGVAEHIRRSERQETPIIAISGTPWLADRRRCAFDTILPKPFTLKTLIEAVNGVLRGAVVAAV